ITNTGNVTVTVSQVTTTGTGFSGSGITVPLTLAAGQSATYSVQFAPASASSATGQISFVSNASNSPTLVTLGGTGTTAPVAQLSASPTSVSLGNVSVGGSGTQAVSVTNTGAASVTISQITTTGPGFSGSGISVPLTLAAGQSATYTAQFTPATAGAATGQISFVSNATNSPTLVALSGTGTLAQLSVSPTSVSFGNVSVGSSGTQAVTISNTGNVSVTVSQITATGTGFSGSGIAVPLTLAAGQSATYTAKFAPTAAGAVPGQISFVSNASNSPTLVALSGTGTLA